MKNYYLMTNGELINEIQRLTIERRMFLDAAAIGYNALSKCSLLLNELGAKRWQKKFVADAIEKMQGNTANERIRNYAN